MLKANQHNVAEVRKLHQLPQLFGTVLTVLFYMTSSPKLVRLVLPVPSFGISGPMIINATVKASSRSSGWTPTQVFLGTTRTLIN